MRRNWRWEELVHGGGHSMVPESSHIIMCVHGARERDSPDSRIPSLRRQYARWVGGAFMFLREPCFSQIDLEVERPKGQAVLVSNQRKDKMTRPSEIPAFVVWCSAF